MAVTETNQIDGYKKPHIAKKGHLPPSPPSVTPAICRGKTPSGMQ